MVRHTLKILQHLLQGFQSVSDHIGTLCITGLKSCLFIKWTLIFRVCLCDLVKLGKTEEKKGNNRQENENLKEIELKICKKRWNKFREK